MAGWLREWRGGGWWAVEVEGLPGAIKARTTQLVPLPDGEPERAWRDGLSHFLYRDGREPTGRSSGVLHQSGACGPPDGHCTPPVLTPQERAAAQDAVFLAGAERRC